MIDFQYEAFDIKTGRMVGRIPGVANLEVTHQYNDFGTFSASIAVDANWSHARHLLVEDATEPGRMGFYVLADGEPISCCEIWTRTGRDPSTISYNIAGSLTGSYLGQRHMNARDSAHPMFQFTKVDPGEILRQLIIRGTSGEYGDTSINMEKFATVTRQKPITAAWGAMDAQTYADRIKTVTGGRAGIDWRFFAYRDGNGALNRSVRWARQPTAAEPETELARKDALTVAYKWNGNSYRGNTYGFSFDEDGARRSTDFLAYGEGEGRKKLRAYRTNDLLASAYPRTSKVQVGDAKVVDGVRQLVDDMYAQGRDALIPFRLKVPAEGVLGQMWPGDYVNIDIDPTPTLPRGVHSQNDYRIIDLTYNTVNQPAMIDMTVGRIVYDEGGENLYDPIGA